MDFFVVVKKTFLWCLHHIHRIPTHSVKILDSRIDTAQDEIFIFKTWSLFSSPGWSSSNWSSNQSPRSDHPSSEPTIFDTPGNCAFESCPNTIYHLVSVIHTVGSKCTSNPQTSPSQEASPNSEPQSLLREPRLALVLAGSIGKICAP